MAHVYWSEALRQVSCIGLPEEVTKSRLEESTQKVTLFTRSL